MKSSSIKLFLAVALWGVASLSLVICDDDDKGGCSPSNASEIVLFTAGDSVTLSGNLYALSGSSLRGKVDNLCKAEKPGALTCTTVRALISLSSKDQIADFPTRYCAPTDVPVKDPTGNHTFANNWADLMDGSIAVSLYNAGLASPSWTQFLSGSDTSGHFLPDSSCSGWTSSDNGVAITWGYANESGNGWLSFENSNYCMPNEETSRIMCLCY